MLTKPEDLVGKECLFGVVGREVYELITAIFIYDNIHLKKLTFGQKLWKIEFASGRSAIITNSSLNSIILNGCVKYKIHGKSIRWIL